MPEDESIDDLYARLVPIRERISELEKKCLGDYRQRLFERIEELEKKIFHDYGGDLNKIEDAAIIQIELVKQISELKELLKVDNERIADNKLCILNGKEILRELIEIDIKGIEGKDKMMGYIPSAIISITMKRLLDKLDQKDGEKPSECPICDGTGTNTHVETDKFGTKKFVEYPCQCQKEPTYLGKKEDADANK